MDVQEYFGKLRFYAGFGSNFIVYNMRFISFFFNLLFYLFFDCAVASLL